MKSENGFTLFELLVTIAIIGLVSSIALMSSSNLYSNYKVKEAARQIYSDLQAARINSIKEGRRWAVCFSGTTFTSYSIRNTPGTDTTFCTGDDPTTGASPFYRKNIDFTGGSSSSLTYSQNFSAAAPFAVIFNPTGTASFSSAGTIGTATIRKGTKTIKVTVNQNSGNVRIQ